MNSHDREALDLLHRLGHLHLKAGNSKKALVLLLVASRISVEHTPLMCSLVEAFISNGQISRALKTIDSLEGSGLETYELELMRSKAYWADGNMVAAREHFDTYVAERGGSVGESGGMDEGSS